MWKTKGSYGYSSSEYTYASPKMTTFSSQPCSMFVSPERALPVEFQNCFKRFQKPSPYG